MASLAVAVGFEAPASAQSTPVVYTVALNGAQEVPPVATAGTGSATVTLNALTGDVSVSGAYSGMTGPVTAAHLHSPSSNHVPTTIALGPPHGPAEVVLPLTITLSHTGGTSGTFSGSATLTPSQAAGLFDGLYYLQLHTTAFPDGEIRGEIEDSVFQVALDAGQEVPPVPSAGSGTATVTLATGTGAVSVSGSYSGLTSAATAAHIHGPAAPGVSAGIVVTLSHTGGTSGTFGGSGTLTAAQAIDMLDGLYYLNVHTATFGAGEIRGQIVSNQVIEHTIGNGLVELTVASDPEFGLVYKFLKSFTAKSAGAEGTDGMGLARSDTWKITLRDSSFTPVSGWTPPALDPAPKCPVLPPDGLIHIRPSEATSAPVILVDAGPAPGGFTAVWTVNSWNLKEHDEDLASFPTEPFEVVLRAEAKPGNDFVSLGMDVRLAGESTNLSVYRMELRAAVNALADPEHQILAIPWYFGVLVPRPLETEFLHKADCTADVRLSDPVLGSTVPTHPGAMSMQWMAYYEEDDPGGDLLFWGTRDTGGHIKPYLIYPEPKALGFGVQFYPENNLTVTGNEDVLPPFGEPDYVRMPFDVTLTALKGDWYDAAQFYREWALEQPWVPSVKPGEPGGDPSLDYSDVVYNADGLGAISLGLCDPPAGTTAQDLCDVPKGLSASEKIQWMLANCEGVTQDHNNFAYWESELASLKSLFGISSTLSKPWFWDENSFDACSGSWFPIQPSFLAGTPSDPWAPYFHPLLFCEQSPGFATPYVPGYTGESVADYVVKDELGAPHASVTVSFPKAGGCAPKLIQAYTQDTLCAGTPFPLDYTVHVISQFLAQGVTLSGLYLDEYHRIERICYDEDHYHNTVGAVVGGGSYATAGKQLLTILVKQILRGGNPEAFLWIEGPSEAYLPWVELCNMSYGGVFGGNPLEGSTVRRVPMFQAVYKEYQRFASVAPVNVPENTGVLQSAQQMALARHAFARFSYEASEVPTGAVLSADSLPQNLAKFPHFARAVDLLVSSMGALKTPEARELLRFGRRLRDPKTDSASAYLPLGMPPAQASWFPTPGANPAHFPDRMGKLTVPLVYAMAGGEPGERVALLLVNWTAAEDAAITPALFQPLVQEKGALASSTPGDQTVHVTLDLADYGFTEADYGSFALRDVQTGQTTTVSWAGTPLEPAFVVPGLSARLIVVEPM